MRPLLTVLVVLVFLLAAPVLQGTVLFRAAPGGVTVDLAFLAAVSVGLVVGGLAGLVTGLLGGLLLGTAVGDAALPMAVLYGITGAAAGVAGGRRPLLAALPVAAALTVLLLGLETVVLAPLGGMRPSLRPALALAGWHAALVLPLALVWRRLALAPPPP